MTNIKGLEDLPDAPEIMMNLLTSLQGLLPMITEKAVLNYCDANPKQADANIEKIRHMVKLARYLATNG